MAFDRDLVIAGGGPVGAALALSLADAEFRLLVCEARARGEPPADGRSLALSHGSRLILERLGVWSRLARAGQAVAPIQEVRVAQKEGEAEAIFRAAELGLPALGYVIAYRDLVAAFDHELASRRLEVLWETPLTGARGTAAYAWYETRREQGTAALLALADGARIGSFWEHDYGQQAVLASVRVESAQACAFERFTSLGPIALLPQGDRHALIWTLPSAQALEILRFDDARFLARLAEQFGAGGEAIAEPGPRTSLPLRLRMGREIAGHRLALLGNAAQTLHPVAGQGFNLGLRDAYELAQVLLDDHSSELGSERQLQCYKNRRRIDRWGSTLATHLLVELFGWQGPSVARLRDRGLELFGTSKTMRRVASHLLMHGWR